MIFRSGLINSLIHCVLALLENDYKVTAFDNLMNGREGNPAELIANNSKAQKILNWKPGRSLEYGIKTAYEWEKILNKWGRSLNV